MQSRVQIWYIILICDGSFYRVRNKRYKSWAEKPATARWHLHLGAGQGRRIKGGGSEGAAKWEAGLIKAEQRRWHASELKILGVVTSSMCSTYCGYIHIPIYIRMESPPPVPPPFAEARQLWAGSSRTALKFKCRQCQGRKCGALGLM